MGVFVGLDCGGSSSRVLAVDEDGNIVFQGQSGAANLASTPDSRLRRNLSHATEGCPRADYVCGCFAGLVNKDLARRGEEHLSRLFPRAAVRAEPDYTAALYASPEGTDLCVISGTGSLVCSRHKGMVVKSGGRGYILGDYGSGYRYGLDAVLHFLDHPDKASDHLRDSIKDAFGSEEEGAIIAQVYQGTSPATVLGKLARALAHDAKAGEAYALDSVERNTRSLAEIVAAHVERYLTDKESVGISLTGGTWKAASMIRDQFEQHVKELLPRREVNLQRTVRPPLYGAVELAKEMSHGN